MAKHTFYKQTTAVEAVSTATVYEIEKPSRFIHLTPEKIQLLQPARWGLWIFLTGLVSSLVLIAVFVLMGVWYLNAFQKTAQVEVLPLAQTVWNHRHTNLFAEKPVITFLLLGLDQSKQLRENSILTDTIALVTVNQQGEINLISIPRDLWIESLKTKINALYYYGQQNNLNNGIVLVSSVVTEITGLPIDYHIIVNMDSVKNIVDALGGITVDVKRSFTDKEYPREIDLTSNDPAVLYETISFTAGKQNFDGATALKFIRSRHSDDEIEGTDEGRELRQQQVLQALMAKAKDVSFITNPKLVGSLYQIWKQDVTTNADDVFLAQLALNLRSQAITINQVPIPVSTKDQEGIIYHPSVGPAKQWVYMPVDTTWSSLQSWVKAQVHP